MNRQTTAKELNREVTSELFRQTGGASERRSSGLTLYASWPLGGLVMTDDGIVHRIFRQRKFFQYSDIESVQISLGGSVLFKMWGDDTLYAFSGTGLKQIVSILEAKGVEIAAEERQKLGFAVGVVWAFAAFGLAFLTLWAAGIMSGILQIVLGA